MPAATEKQLQTLTEAGWTDTAQQPQHRPMWDRFLEGGIMQSVQVIRPLRDGWEATHLQNGIRDTEVFYSENLDDVIAEAEKWVGGQPPMKGLSPATNQGMMLAAQHHRELQ